MGSSTLIASQKHGRPPCTHAHDKKKSPEPLPLLQRVAAADSTIEDSTLPPHVLSPRLSPYPFQVCLNRRRDKRKASTVKPMSAVISPGKWGTTACWSVIRGGPFCAGCSPSCFSPELIPQAKKFRLIVSNPFPVWLPAEQDAPQFLRPLSFVSLTHACVLCGNCEVASRYFWRVRVQANRRRFRSVGGPSQRETSGKAL